MTPDELISAIKVVVHDAALNGVVESLRSPPGRRPPKKTTELSQWYLSLPAKDRDMVRHVAKHSIHAAIFGLLAVLDGVTAIESTEDKGEIEVLLQKGGQTSRLNRQSEDLHDLYQSLVWNEVFEE